MRRARVVANIIVVLILSVTTFSVASSCASESQTASAADAKRRASQDKRVLVVDIGGTSVTMLATGQTESRRFPSGPTMTPAQMVAGVKGLVKDWVYDAVSIGYPGWVVRGRAVAEPHNLAPGWIGFDFEAAFGRPVKLINDAAMQALGSYKGGTMLFLGFGTGLGSALIVEGNVVPMELGHLSYLDATYEDYVGIRGLQRLGQDEWEKHVADTIARLIEGIHPDDVVLGGGNALRLETLPSGCRIGSNDNAFQGGFRLWSEARSMRTVALWSSSGSASTVLLRGWLSLLCRSSTWMSTTYVTVSCPIFSSAMYSTFWNPHSGRDRDSPPPCEPARLARALLFDANAGGSVPSASRS